jgi:Xaa-Pro aminopeptidase
LRFSEPLTIATSAEALLKRSLTLQAAAEAGFDCVVATRPATVRWLLCGRGRPVSASSAVADYTLLLADGKAYALFPDIETSRVVTEERLEELEYEPVPFPWTDGPEPTLTTRLDGRRALTGAGLEAAIAPSRRLLTPDERERYRRAGADAAAAMAACLARLRPEQTETDAAAELAHQARLRGFFPPVVLVAGDERQKVHRHPLPTAEPLGRHALLAITAERQGLHVSLTRIVSFGPPPTKLAGLVRKVAEIDAVVLAASRPGRTLGEVFGDLADAYAERGLPEEWRRHHQGGLTGYEGREVFATPAEPTVIPESCAVAWNPSITGGAKSEDTALVTSEGVQVITRTPDLPELELDGVRRPAIVEV